MTDAPTAVALGISYSVTLDAQRSLVFQTHVERDVEPSAMNAVIDKMVAAANRQYATVELKNVKRQLEIQKTQLRRVTEDLSRLDDQARDAWTKAGKRGEFKLARNEEMHRENARVTQERFKEEITKLEVEVAELEKTAKE